MNKENIGGKRLVFITVLGMIGMAALVLLGGKGWDYLIERDAKFAEGAQRYEQCVLEKYEMTVEHYRDMAGAYPVCLSGSNK